MAWVDKAIGDLGLVITGKTPSTKNRDFYNGGYLFVTPTDLDWDSYYVRKTHTTVSDEAKQILGSKFLPKNSIFFTCIASVGKMGIASEECLTNQQINSIIPNEEFDSKFVYYLLRRYVQKIRSIGLSGGSAVPIINKSGFCKIKVRVPDNKKEKIKIGSVLSGYDDLIENNQHRIVLLEKSANLLYQEWFVNFRYPQSGNKNDTNALPNGWQEMLVSEVIQRVPAGKTYSQKSVISAGKFPVLGQSNNGVIGYHDNEPSVEASADEPVIVFANHTCNQRFMFEPFSGIKNILPFKPKFPEKHDIYWLHHATGVLIKMNAYKGHWPELVAKTLVVPTSRLTFDFGNQIKPIHLQIFNLMKQNEKLAKARDLLLPRLIDGKIKL